MSDMTFEQACRKVRKLLALARDPAAMGAAAEALAKAHAIMATHRIEEAVLDAEAAAAGRPREDPMAEQGTQFAAWDQDRRWARRLVHVVSRHNGCTSYVLNYRNGKEGYGLFGRGSDLQVAAAMLDFFRQEIKRLTDAATPGWTQPSKIAFRLGVIDAVDEMLTDAEAEAARDAKSTCTCTDLVLASALKSVESRYAEALAASQGQGWVKRRAGRANALDWEAREAGQAVGRQELRRFSGAHKEVK